MTTILMPGVWMIAMRNTYKNKIKIKNKIKNKIMKKTVRLTESDLTRIVKRVVIEQNEEDRMEGEGMSITIKDIFEEVRDALDKMGGYRDSMKTEAMQLAINIMSSMQDDLAYVIDNYEEDLDEILGDEDYDDEEDEY